MDRTNVELTHVVNNKLSVIIAMCDHLFQQSSDPAIVAGLHTIHMAAQTLADEVNKPLGRGQGT